MWSYLQDGVLIVAGVWAGGVVAIIAAHLLTKAAVKHVIGRYLKL